ncbi:hypothetical protein HDV64DRAFT_32959 [Trichoderma sp. TUCIM 5745]
MYSSDELLVSTSQAAKMQPTSPCLNGHYLCHAFFFLSYFSFEQSLHIHINHCLSSLLRQQPTPVMTFSTPTMAYLASLPELTSEKVFGMIYLSIILIHYPEIQRFAEQRGDIRCAFYFFLFVLCFTCRYCIPHIYMFWINIFQLGSEDLYPIAIEIFFAP